VFAVIGGSGAYDLLAAGLAPAERLGPVQTPFGPSQAIYRLFAFSAHETLFLSRHGERGYELNAASVNYRANLYALKERGATKVLAWSGPGAIDPSLPPGSLVIPDDLLDLTHGRECTFYRGTGLGVIRQWPVFCRWLCRELEGALTELGLDFRSGATYVCTEGPRLETPAEIRAFAALRAHLVGMTLVPEVFLARELELCYAALCYVVNWAEGVRPAEVDPTGLFGGLFGEEEKRAVEAVLAQFPALLTVLARRLESAQPSCRCAEAMARYRREGRIGEDWREWVGDD